MMGLDISRDLATELTAGILATAREVGGFVRIDMEGSIYAARTMALFEKLHDQYPEEVGIVIQS